MDFVAQCLGVDPKKYKFSVKQEDDNPQAEVMMPSAVLKTETFKNLEERAASKLKICCPNCFATYPFPGVISRDSATISGMVCGTCKEILPLPYLINRVKLSVK